MAASLRPPHATDPPPPWLDPSQADCFRMLLYILRESGAALSAEPVGTGKTYIALAVAHAIGGDATTAIVPAALVEQWRYTAARLGVRITIWSHTLLSRGRLPPGDPGLVIIDESHHFRNPAIRRYRTLAPWLIGRRTLLLSATPVVNSARDAYHQLHLGLRDDALSMDGASSMRVAFERGAVPPALGRFLVQRLDGTGRPHSRCRTVVLTSGAVSCLPALESLELSNHAAVAALIRSVLLRAAASSAAAIEASLRRYRSLLLHARDARDSGRTMNRASIRRFTSGADAQLLLWAMLPADEREGELCLDDLPRVESLIARVHNLAGVPDDKSRSLRTILSDGLLTVVFVGARETITHLRNLLADRPIAWCTGERSGIGRACLPRQTVLRWFRPGISSGPAALSGSPIALLATDVAAEGLDLQAAGRIVHYDLPWTDVRMEQRNGRAVRRGASHESVEVIRFAPDDEVESRLRQQERLVAKAGLPQRLGLGLEGRSRWRWRAELSGVPSGPSTDGVAGVLSNVDGVLAGVALEAGRSVMVSSVLWRELGAGWVDSADEVKARLFEALAAPRAAPPSDAELQCVLESMVAPVRHFLRQASAHRVAGSQPSRTGVRLGRRLRALAAEAARRRDDSMLQALDAALAFCTGGHTAGEEMLIEELAGLDARTLLARLPSLPSATQGIGPLRPRLTGLIVFRRS